jgi:hypothetical protein
MVEALKQVQHDCVVASLGPPVVTYPEVKDLHLDWGSIETKARLPDSEGTIWTQSLQTSQPEKVQLIKTLQPEWLGPKSRFSESEAGCQFSTYLSQPRFAGNRAFIAIETSGTIGWLYGFTREGGTWKVKVRTLMWIS